MIQVLLLLLSVLLQQAPTLGSELLARNLPAPPGQTDLEQAITSFAAFGDSRWFVIGYYYLEDDGLLHELQVRSFDKRTKRWLSATFEPIGSVISVTRHGGFIYLKGHGNPSAGSLLVLTDNLRRHRTLDGWPEWFADDGRVVFQRSMRHFQPAHAGVLALYDPLTDRESALFPSSATINDRGFERLRESQLVVDRSFGPVERGAAADTIQFVVTSQTLRLTADRPEPAGPTEQYLVICDLKKNPPKCSRR